MNWQKIVLNIIGNLSAQGGAIAFVPEKYQPATMAGLAFAGAMIALFQQQPHKQAEKIKIPKIIWAALLIASFGFLSSGCGPGGLFLPNIKDYTPEQLESFKDLGYDAVRCANVKGPPPSGNVSTVTIPKGRGAKVLFTGCDVHSIEITGEAAPPGAK